MFGIFFKLFYKYFGRRNEAFSFVSVKSSTQRQDCNMTPDPLLIFSLASSCYLKFSSPSFTLFVFIFVCTSQRYGAQPHLAICTSSQQHVFVCTSQWYGTQPHLAICTSSQQHVFVCTSQRYGTQPHLAICTSSQQHAHCVSETFLHCISLLFLYSHSNLIRALSIYFSKLFLPFLFGCLLFIYLFIFFITWIYTRPRSPTDCT
jgi:hypothetical protein